MHTLNGDPNVARLQQYTVNLYREIEAESGQNCGIHLPGGIQLADTPERLDWLRMAQARGRYLGMHMEIISMKEAKELNPLLEEKYFVGALYDEDEGSVDPYGVTHAYTICARNRGAEVYQNTWVNGSPSARTAPGTCTPTTPPPATPRAPSTPSTSSTPAACGRVRSAAWPASSCPCSRWSTTT
jgi:glycine/D-amino acid oxidase-like deaminating enzyme